ncbi:MAG: hypothetical protein NT150_04795 [Bacteroidetes bacterium]|nr:hypothetical protein [Bacteroidota bacterium]
MIKSKLLSASLLLFGFYACSEEKSTATALSLKNNDAEVFTLKNNEDDTLLLPTGSSVIVPAGAIVDAQGAPVNGEVKLSFNEYHTKGEILLSGLPMTYKDSIFESAGMFSVNAHCDGSPVFISKRKPITVNIASEKKGDFNLYELKDSSWAYIEKAKIKDEHLECTGDQLEVSKPFEVANEDLKLIEFDVNYSKMPELKGFSQVMWTYAGEKDADNPEKNKWIYDQVWTDTKIERLPSKYKLTLEKGAKYFVTYVRPVFLESDKKLAEARFSEALNKYEQTLAKRNKLSNTAGASDLVRSAALYGFGTYNFDKCKGNLIDALVSFKLNNKSVHAAMAYLVLQNSVVSYVLENGNYSVQLPLNESKYKLAVAVNDSTFAFVSRDEILEKANTFNKGSLQQFELDVQIFPKSMSNLKALERFLEEI